MRPPTAEPRRPWFSSPGFVAAAGGRDFNLGQGAIEEIENVTKIYQKRAQTET